jgi:peptidoglycan hydrolase-like protein with peptidoglycan-binding domain
VNQQANTGEYLVVDGIFGPRTEAAVRRFCTASGIGGLNGSVNYDVWRRVVGAEWQIIDSVDRTDHDSRKHRIDDHEDLAPYGQTLLEQFGLSGGAPRVLNEVHARARPGEVVLLRFHGHGGPGEMIVSSGRIAGEGSSFDHRYGANFFNALQALRPIFAPFGSVEMHGCRVGQGRAGRALLSGMADALGVPVTGGINQQLGGGRTTYRFEGLTQTICPNGMSLRNWSLKVGTASVLRP